jgi:gamma-glutamylcyclotransferase (GGCT)/AIG2-like uncharacterized protein YtfP
VTDLTFAYGSNLSRGDWERFCRERGADPSVLQRVGRGFLPDRELCFSRWSEGRQGGVLGLRPRLGQAVDGWLFRVRSAEGWRLLDAKEGVPKAYAPHEATVLRPLGRRVRAVVYEVRRPERWVEPAPEYLGLVRRARRSLGLDTAVLDAVAVDASAPWLVRDLFVYGTLRRGGVRHGVLEEAGIERVESATAPGRVIDLGAYPGLVEGVGLVQGECVTLSDPAAAMAICDEVEGFTGWEGTGSLFRRALMRCRTGDAVRWAWHYRPCVTVGWPTTDGPGADRPPEGA